jgi:hypothetical protein
MLRLVLSLTLSLAAGAALAQRPSTLGMSCAQAVDLVRARGAVVLGTGGHTYDRYVAAPGYCLPGEYVYWAYVPTRDAGQCRVGFVCEPGSPLFDEDFPGEFLHDR